MLVKHYHQNLVYEIKNVYKNICTIIFSIKLTKEKISSYKTLKYSIWLYKKGLYLFD